MSGRNNIDWDERFEMDNWYCEHVSFRLDLAILLKTLRTVVSGSDVTQDGRATVDYFKGNGEKERSQ